MPDPVASNGPADAVRRAPFGANPHVGARGQRTRHRILDAALRVFGEVGLHQGSVERIAREAGCSRAAFYQYFADKDDVLRHLGGQLQLQLDAAVAWLGAVTPDPDGWKAVRDLLGRWAKVHHRHRPVFDAFPALFDVDPVFASDATRARARFSNAIAARVEGSDLAPGAVDDLADLFVVVLPQALDDLGTMREAAPDAYPSGATLDAIADVYHRSLFGVDEPVNVHRHHLPAPPRLAFGPLVRAGIEQRDADTDDRATRAVLLNAARACFLEHGFHGTRIDMIAEAAGVSHGTLYTYFQSKDQVALVLAMSAMRAAADAIQRMPAVGDGVGTRELRRWLDEYNQAQAGETAMLTVWSDAFQRDADRVEESAPTLDWGRRQLVRRLAGRGFGDVDLEAAVLLALLSSLGSRERAGTTLDAAAVVIARGFYGNPGPD